MQDVDVKVSTSAVMKSEVRKTLAKARLGVQCPSHPPRTSLSDLRLQPSELKPKWLTSHLSQRWPATPGWHSHCPVWMSHWPLVEPSAWQLHLVGGQTNIRRGHRGGARGKGLSKGALASAAQCLHLPKVTFPAL